MIWGQTRVVTNAAIKMGAWLSVMNMAVKRIFQNGRVSRAPMIRFMTFITATNKLAESQSRATRPKDRPGPEADLAEGQAARGASQRASVAQKKPWLQLAW